MHALKRHPKNPDGIEPGDKVAYVGGGAWDQSSYAPPPRGTILTVADVTEFSGEVYIYPKELQRLPNGPNPSDYIHAFKLHARLNKMVTGSKARLFIGGKEIPLQDVQLHVNVERHNHQWKVYDSGWSRDEYCTVCNQKRPI